MDALKRMWLRWRHRSDPVSGRLEREIDEEIDFHLDMRTRENVEAGMGSDDARLQAQRRLGELDEVRRAGWGIRRRGERNRGIRRLLGDLRQDARFAVRSMMAAPGITAIALLALTLGIGASTAIFSVVDAVLLDEFPYEDPDELVQFTSRSLVDENVDAWREELTTLERVSFFTMEAHEMSGPAGAYRAISIPADIEFFPLFGVDASLGRTFVEDDSRPDAPLTTVITDRLWRRAFGGEPGVIGNTIVLDGEPATVIGVMPPGFTFLTYDEADIFLPLRHSRRGATMAIGRLRDGVSVERGRNQANTLAVALEPEDSFERLSLLNYYTLYDGIVGGDRPTIVMLSGAVSFVLLIACANVANLLLARALARKEEISVRAAMGAAPGRLVRQLVTESTLLAGIGGILGILVAMFSLPALLSISPGYLARLDNVAIDFRVLGFAVTVSMLTGVLFGLAPAAFAGRSDLKAAMVVGGQPSDPRHQGWALNAMVVAEIALSLVLLVGTGLLVRSFLELRPTSPGFDSHGKLLFELRTAERRYPDDASRTLFFDQMLAELGSLPGVEAATAVSAPPMVGMVWSIEAVPSGVDPESRDLPMVWLERAASNYHEVMDIAVVRGRALGSRDSANAPEIVVSENAARALWPDGDDPLGRVISLKRPEMDFVVVGVAADTRRMGLSLRPRPTVWVRYQDAPDSRLTFIAHTRGAPDALASPVSELVRRLDPELPVLNLQTMEALLYESVSEPRFYATMMSIFGGIAISLAAVGFYGVMSYAVGRRTRELSIRMALGASPGALMGAVMRRGALIIAFGIALGLVACLALTRVIESLLFGFSATEPSVYAILVLLVVAVGLLACYLPARRVTRVDPLIAMRSP